MEPIFLWICNNFFQILWKSRCDILVSFPSHWKKYVFYRDFDLKSWNVVFFTRFTRENTPQNNFSSQNFSVENNYVLKWLLWFLMFMMPIWVLCFWCLISFSTIEDIVCEGSILGFSKIPPLLFHLQARLHSVSRFFIETFLTFFNYKLFQKE